MASSLKSRGWLAVGYPDSLRVGWYDTLCELGQQCLISPLHDRDVNADGTPKKPHYHFILLWDGPTTYNHAKDIADEIGLVIPPPFKARMATLRGAARYLCHQDNPEKAQYSTMEVLSVGGIDYDNCTRSNGEDLAMFTQIRHIIKDRGFVVYDDLLDYLEELHPDLYAFVFQRGRENVWKVLLSRQYKFDREAKTHG